MIKLWLIPKNLPTLSVTTEESHWADTLSGNKKKEYLHSRGYIRKTLGNLLDYDPLDLPLVAPPNQPPKIILANKSFISISHCNDYLLFGYSNFPFGLDIERSDRKILAEKITKRFITEKENLFLKNLPRKDYSKNILKFWVSKESAIKYTKGKLFRDLKLWECDFNNDKIFKKKDNLSLHLSVFKFKNWYLSIASDNKSILKNLLICYG